MKSNTKLFIRWIGFLLMMVFIVLSLNYLDGEKLWKETRVFFTGNPMLLVFLTFMYFLAFASRALAWKLYLGVSSSVKFFNCLKGILYSLLVNHLVPLKVGDVMRIGYLTKVEKDISIDESVHSVLVLRTLDMLILLGISFVGLLYFYKITLISISPWMPSLLLILSMIGFWIIQKWKPYLVRKHWELFKNVVYSRNFIVIFLLILSSWCLEGAVLWGVAKSLENPILALEAIWINSLTVGGQVFQVTPGGLTTYESVMTISLSFIHYPVQIAYQAAIISHVYKFVFSYVIGFLLMIRTPLQTSKQIKEMLQLKGMTK